MTTRSNRPRIRDGRRNWLTMCPATFLTGERHVLLGFLYPGRWLGIIAIFGLADTVVDGEVHFREIEERKQLDRASISY